MPSTFMEYSKHIFRLWQTHYLDVMCMVGILPTILYEYATHIMIFGICQKILVEYTSGAMRSFIHVFVHFWCIP
jgi:hypothetical protein